jgi:hypothetical protein
VLRHEKEGKGTDSLNRTEWEKVFILEDILVLSQESQWTPGWNGILDIHKLIQRLFVFVPIIAAGMSCTMALKLKSNQFSVQLMRRRTGNGVYVLG